MFYSCTPTSPKGCHPDSGHRGRRHASGHHRVKQLLWVGAVCRGLFARQQPLNNCWCSDWILRCHPLLHHVRGEYNHNRNTHTHPLSSTQPDLRALQWWPSDPFRPWTAPCPMWSWVGTAPRPQPAVSPWRSLALTPRSTWTRPLT